MRVKITLACTECKQRNYDTKKNKKTGKVSVNVEFEAPAKNGKKSTDLKNLKVVRKEFINAWKRIS